MNTRTVLTIVAKIIAVAMLFYIAEQLEFVGMCIDLLLLGVYYGATKDSKELAEDTVLDEQDIKKRIEALEKKN